MDNLNSNQEEEKSILIVDDSKAARSMIKAELSEGNYKLFEVDSGPKAIKLLDKEHIDLIILDVEMPEMNGFQVCKIIRENEEKAQEKNKEKKINRIPVVFFTGNDDLKARAMGFDAGAKEFLSKKYAIGEVLFTVEKILRSKGILRGLTAVVVDESKTARSITSSHLEDQGVCVVEFSSGDEAFEYLKENGENVDILITDSVLSGMNGRKLCENVRKKLVLKIPIIIVTSDIDRSNMLQFYKLGATDYLIKPYLKEELIARLNSHLEIRLMYHNLEKKNVELQLVNKLKDKFLSACTHDLRSPLNSILGFVELLNEELVLEEDQKGYLKHIESSGQSLLELIDELLDFTKLQMEDFEATKVKVDFFKLCKDSLVGTELIASKKNIKLNVTEQNKIGELLVNENAIRRLMINLVSNSIKFTPNGGKIDVNFKAKEKSIEVVIKDYGIGIPNEQLDKLFTDEFNLNRSGTSGEKSNGFGLGIVKSIVDQHNATIKVESIENKGTTFIIDFKK